MSAGEPQVPTHQVTSQTAVLVELHVPGSTTSGGQDVVDLWVNNLHVHLSRQDFRHFVATVEQAGRQAEAAFERAPSRGIEPTA